MTVAVVALAIALASAAGGLVAMGAWLRSALVDRGHALEDRLAELRRGDQLLAERDQATTRAAELAAQNAELTRRLERAELARNTATKEDADHVAKSIRSQPSAAGALAALNAELQPPVVSVAPDADTAAPLVHVQHPPLCRLPERPQLAAIAGMPDPSDPRRLSVDVDTLAAIGRYHHLVEAWMAAASSCLEVTP